MRKLILGAIILISCSKEKQCTEVFYDYNLNGCHRCLDFKQTFKNDTLISEEVTRSKDYCDSGWKSQIGKVHASGVYYVDEDYFSEITYTRCFSQPEINEDCKVVDYDSDDKVNCIDFYIIWDGINIIADSAVELGTFDTVPDIHHLGISWHTDTLGVNASVVKRTICL